MIVPDQWHHCVLYGSAAQYAANPPKGSHVFVEGELSDREYTRTIESESEAVNVQWPVAEIVVDSIKVLDRKKRESKEKEGAAWRLSPALWRRCRPEAGLRVPVNKWDVTIWTARRPRIGDRTWNPAL